ncbi:MAG: hypothetical protein CM15mP58_16900 [Burkholderiaceae bacterium]|nr:MAG: hypothetical protein CM15mP58_16900 [Burkholderiaceae bacterium]
MQKWGNKFQEVDSLVLVLNCLRNYVLWTQTIIRKNALINQMPVKYEGTAIKNRLKRRLLLQSHPILKRYAN